MAVTIVGESTQSPGPFPDESALAGVTLPKPSVLLVTAYRWPSSARVAMAFAGAGWHVEAVCPRGHIFENVQAIRGLHDYHFLDGASSVRRAISSTQPDLVVPCDDLAAGLLRHLCDFDVTSSGSGELHALLTRSLGDASSYRDLDSRSRIANLAKQQGVAVPQTDVVRSDAELEAWVVRNELPAFLKTDGSSGGYGVRLVSTLAEARRAFASLRAPIGILRALKRAVFDNAKTFIVPALKRTRSVVNIQKCVPGEEATCTAACWQGKVLACLVLRVLKTNGPVGYSTVVQVVSSPDILQAVERMVRCLGISGLCGFDFVIEPRSGRPFLIEINPRATQTTHLGLGTGNDLPLALRSGVTGNSFEPRLDNRTGDIIALFPQEWLRDPHSEFLRTAHHDVPWSEAEFVRACFSSRAERTRPLLKRNCAPATLLAKTPEDALARKSDLQPIGR